MQDIFSQHPMNRNKALLGNLMTNTFPERRELVTQKAKLKTAKEINEIYPLLFTTESIKEEFTRLMDYDGMAKMISGLEAIQDKVMGLQKGKESELVTGVRARILTEGDPERRSCKLIL